MKKARFGEVQIVGILKETEAGLKVEDVCRKHGIQQMRVDKTHLRFLYNLTTLRLLISNQENHSRMDLLSDLMARLDVSF